MQLQRFRTGRRQKWNWDSFDIGECREYHSEHKQLVSIASAARSYGVRHKKKFSARIYQKDEGGFGLLVKRIQ